METLIKIQGELKVAKNNYNAFGKYKYRSAEDILEAVKPLCVKNGALLTISDNITQIGEWIFVESTVTFKHGEFEHSVTGYARHAENKKGMDDSQVTGATSSYARKYALNGLFCIDDNKDSDAMEKATKKSDEFNEAITELEQAESVSNVKAIWESYPKLQSNKEFIKKVTETKKKLAK